MDYLKKSEANRGYSSTSSMAEKMVSDMSVQAIKIAMKSQADIADFTAEYKSIKKELNNALYQIGEKETLLAKKTMRISQLEAEVKKKEEDLLEKKTEWEEEKRKNTNQWYNEYSKAKKLGEEVDALKKRLSVYEKEPTEG